MQGPEIQGPQIWLELNRKAESKILDYHRANEERIANMLLYVEECKRKLGVQVQEEPSFVPKVMKGLCMNALVNIVISDSWQERGQI